MVREDEGLGVRDAPGELDVDDDTNDTLEKDSNDGLKHLKDDRVSALITGSSKPISNGSLCLQAKQEGGPKVIVEASCLSGRLSGSKSPCSQKVKCQMQAKIIQGTRQQMSSTSRWPRKAQLATVLTGSL